MSLDKSILPLLGLPAIDILPKVLGYLGMARFVAFWWAERSLRYYDGSNDPLETGCDGDRHWGLYLQCPRVVSVLAGRQLGMIGGNGAPENKATHHLIIDRHKHIAYIGQPQAARSFIVSKNGAIIKSFNSVVSDQAAIEYLALYQVYYIELADAIGAELPPNTHIINVAEPL